MSPKSSSQNEVTVAFQNLDNDTHRSRNNTLPGNQINGEIAIVKQDAVKIEDTRVYLQGTSRVWLPGREHVETMQHIFLKQVQDLSDATTAINEAAIGTNLTFSVFFRLPTYMASDGCAEDVVDQLPPSVNLGPSYHDHLGRQYMQPLIEYRLVAIVKYRSSFSVDGTQKMAQTSEIIPLEPFPTIEMPPSYSKHQFLEDESISVTVSSSRMRKRDTAQVTASLVDLDFQASQSDPHLQTLKGTLRLHYHPLSGKLQNRHNIPQIIACNIKLLRIVHFGTRPLLHSKPVEAADDAHWKCRRDILSRTLATNITCRPLHRDGAGLHQDDTAGIQFIEVAIPIRTERRLLEPFSTSLASLSYAVQVTVRLKGLHHKRLVVEAPVDVSTSRRLYRLAVEDQQLDGPSEADGDCVEASPPAYDEYA